MQTLQKVALVLIVIGAINWGLVGLFDFNLVETLFGADNVITKVIYVLVGISGIIDISLLFNDYGIKSTDFLLSVLFILFFFNFNFYFFCLRFIT